MSLLLSLQFVQIQFQAIQALLPEPAIFVHPIGGSLQRSSFKSARALLRPADACDQAGAFEDFEMLGNRRQRKRIRLCKFVNRFLTTGQLRQNSPSGGVSQRGKSCTEQIIHASTLPYG
jgi:hypothetical protein